MAREKYMMEAKRKIGGRIYRCLNIFPNKARAIKSADEFRGWGYGARVIKVSAGKNKGWGVYRTPEKIH